MEQREVSGLEAVAITWGVVWSVLVGNITSLPFNR